MLGTKKILLLDDHQLFLEGIRHVVTEIDEQISVEFATSVREALDEIDKGTRYHLMIVDLHLPKLDGFTFLKAISQRKIFTPVLVLSSSNNVDDIQRSLDAGALGYLCKAANSQEMRVAIQKVLAGHLYLADDLWLKLDSYPGTRKTKEVDEPFARLTKLSPRQTEVFNLLCEGKSNTDIASVLNIQETTVKYHIATMFRRFGVNSRVALVKVVKQQLSND